MIIDIECICLFCDKEIQIAIEWDSPSDYYYDYDCPNCGKEMKQIKDMHGKIHDLDMFIYDEIADYPASRAEYYSDEDR